jgi:NAD(P)-dependent dehydrogenase (short-subunit alcohol dehydrogenase family)
MNDFQNKTVVVTGGTSGIGLAAAQRFAAGRADVVLFARSEAGLAAARKEIQGRVHTVQGDVSKRPDLERLFAETKKRFGGVDVLLANAAIVRLSPIADTSEALFDEVVSTNFRGTFETLRLAIPLLRDGASVILTTSWFNRIGFPGSSVLSMTKAGLRSLVRVAAAELAPRRIRVNALSPGAIETPLWAKLGLPAEALDAAGKAITAQIPLARWGSSDEVARAAIFLASEESSYITGTELQVDGGMRQA